mgnify:CR=1 FL=1
MKKSLVVKLLPLTVFFFAFFGCTTLEEEVIDESLTGAGQAEVVSGSIGPVYGFLRGAIWLHTAQFGLQEIASDEAILPYRGGRDWYDGGKFIAVHQHLTTPGNSLVGDTWTDANVLHTCGVFVDIEIHLANHRYVVGNTHRHVEPEIVW